jgi:hypothetical protein
MSCDLLWALGFPSFNYIMRFKGDEEYYPKELMSKEF